MYVRKDRYYRKAKEEGYRSRAAYKLIDIQKKHKIFHKKDIVVDLGCAPGGWLQVIAEEIGAGGRVYGVDRTRVKLLPQNWVTLLQGDIRDAEFQKTLRETVGTRVRVVSSDISPDLSGVGFRDHARSCELVRCALHFARKVSAPGGIFLAKIFQGEDLERVIEEMQSVFRNVRRIVPPASRKESAEIYLLASGYLGASQD